MNLGRAALIALALFASLIGERARLFADVRHDLIISDDTIEVIELNCYPSGRAWVFWDCNGEVCDWEFVRGEEIEPDGRVWLLTLWRAGKCYCVRSRSYVETTTAFDVEVMERQRVPDNKRRRLGEYRSLNPFVAVEG